MGPGPGTRAGPNVLYLHWFAWSECIENKMAKQSIAFQPIKIALSLIVWHCWIIVHTIVIAYCEHCHHCEIVIGSLWHCHCYHCGVVIEAIVALLFLHCVIVIVLLCHCHCVIVLLSLFIVSLSLFIVSLSLWGPNIVVIVYNIVTRVILRWRYIDRISH